MPVKESGLKRIRSIAEKLCAQMDYQLFDVSLDKEHTGKYLRIYIDTDKEGGIDLDDCEKYHRAIQPAVEDYDYDFLEVCSPGADRPIRSPEDALKYKGCIVDVKMYKPFDGQKEFCAELMHMDDESVVLKASQNQIILPRNAVSVIRLHPDLSALDEE